MNVLAEISHVIIQSNEVESVQKIDVANVFQETSHHPLIARFKTNWRFNLHVPLIKGRCFYFIFAHIRF